MLTILPRGTKDILPKEVYKWQYTEKVFAEICAKYGFGEIRTPIFEHTELFLRGVGDTTDIVEKQMYTFDDAGGRSLTLKPEGTAGVARAFIEHKLYAESQPTKLYYRIPCFRYEKPQAGRLREFHQFGVEVFGSENMLADTEVISLADAFLRSLGLKELELRINNIGCPVCREGYKQALRDFFKPRYDELCDTCKVRYEKNPMRIIDCKSPVCREISQGAPIILDYLCDDCRESFEVLQSNLSALGIEYAIDSGIVRGLDYYTKTAFEFVSTGIGAQGTVCGGGRYDNLIEELGGPSVPGVGFGLGIERLLLVLESEGIVLPEPEENIILISFIGDEAQKKGLEILKRLRNAGAFALIDVMGRNIKGQFKYADKIGAAKTIVIGEDEIISEEATVKDMKTGDQVKVPFSEIESILQ